MQAEAGGKLAWTQIITCVHTYAVAEQRQGGSKIRSARIGSNTPFSTSALKLRAPNHLCPQEKADPPASAPRMCEHNRGGGAGMSKSARLRSATAPRICERSLMGPRVALVMCHWPEVPASEGPTWRPAIQLTSLHALVVEISHSMP